MLGKKTLLFITISFHKTILKIKKNVFKKENNRENKMAFKNVFLCRGPEMGNNQV